MRLILPVVLAFSLVGAAMAQAAPRVTIEDDVAPASALACASVRLAQADAATRKGAPDVLAAAAAEAWLKSGVDAVKARAEAAKLASTPADAIAMRADVCAAFEIRSAPPAGG